MRFSRLVLLLAGAGTLAALVLAPASRADLSDQSALAARFAPVVRLVAQTEACGPGEPYRPLDVNLLFGEPTVALRGPWRPPDLVTIAPTAGDLVGRFEYHLDFPGNALDPGCSYERWERWLTREGGSPTVYAHVARDPGYPGKIALQYWFFYVFNDFNNLHEGDWEMIQLDFDTSSAHEALKQDPVAVGYSSHEGAERADWDEDKLEIVDGTHPVVYPAAGSHANKYTAALYLGSSAKAGVGCDDTRGPHVQVLPIVKTIPGNTAAAQQAFPWIAFQGRWGELQPAFFNGPTGPNLKTQWTEPIEWSQGWRSRSYAVPTGGLFGTGATDFFCGAVAIGSKGLIQLLRNPGATLIVLGALLAIALFAATRTSGAPPLRCESRAAAAGGKFSPPQDACTSPTGRCFSGSACCSSRSESSFRYWRLSCSEVSACSASTRPASRPERLLCWSSPSGAILTLLGITLVQAATARALVEIDQGHRVGPVRAYRFAFAKLRPLAGGLAVAVAIVVPLTVTAVLIPVAIWLAVRWALLAQAVELEDRSGLDALRRSTELVRGRWLRVASLVGAGAAIVVIAGPLLGTLLILGTDAPLPLLNVVAGVVYALAMPFVALTTTYVYLDARVRVELEPGDRRAELPPEVDLATG